MLELTYQDFDLWICTLGDGYRAKSWDSHGREATADFRIPWNKLEVENFRLRIGRPQRGMRSVSPERQEVTRRFGGPLFESVFRGELLGCLRASLEEARNHDAGLRIRLRLEQVPDLADLPWEYLFDRSRNRFFALSHQTPVVRYLELPERTRPLQVEGPLRVLVMQSCPATYGELDVEKEWIQLRDTLSDLERRGLIELCRLEEPTLGALQQKLRREVFHIFHFVGHGGFSSSVQQGVLILQDEQGRAHPVACETLGILFHDHPSLRLALLNACEGARTSGTDPFSGVAQTLVRQGIPAVIGMQSEITDDAALFLAQVFYQALTDGYPVDACLTEGRKAILAQDNPEWGTPVLYSRAPGSRLFEVAPAVGDVPAIEPGSRDLNGHLAELENRLKQTYGKKEELETSGQDPARVQQQILALKHQILEGRQLEAGDFLAARRFKLIEVIGSGGYATIWKAYDRQLHQLVVVKVLHGRFAHDRTRRRRFFRGARKMKELQHQAILRVIAERLEDRGYLYFVTEYVAGSDFRQATLSGKLSVDQRIRIVLKVGEALEYAHRHGVIHRDVKPANILVDDRAQPRLTDFDLVRADDTTAATGTEEMLGTFLYAAPESLGNAKEAGAAADVYSLGMTAVFAVSGKDLEARAARDAGSFVMSLSCSYDLKTALAKAVAWEIDQRFHSIADFCRELDRATFSPLKLGRIDLGSPTPRKRSWLRFILNALEKMSQDF